MQKKRKMKTNTVLFSMDEMKYLQPELYVIRQLGAPYGVYNTMNAVSSEYLRIIIVWLFYLPGELNSAKIWFDLNLFI